MLSHINTIARQASENATSSTIVSRNSNKYHYIVRKNKSYDIPKAWFSK
jgi:hypothetical protein